MSDREPQIGPAQHKRRMHRFGIAPAVLLCGGIVALYFTATVVHAVVLGGFLIVLAAFTTWVSTAGGVRMLTWVVSNDGEVCYECGYPGPKHAGDVCPECGRVRTAKDLARLRKTVDKAVRAYAGRS